MARACDRHSRDRSEGGQRSGKFPRTHADQPQAAFGTAGGAFASRGRERFGRCVDRRDAAFGRRVSRGRGYVDRFQRLTCSWLICLGLICSFPMTSSDVSSAATDVPTTSSARSLGWRCWCASGRQNVRDTPHPLRNFTQSRRPIVTFVSWVRPSQAVGRGRSCRALNKRLLVPAQRYTQVDIAYETLAR